MQIARTNRLGEYNGFFQLILVFPCSYYSKAHYIPLTAYHVDAVNGTKGQQLRGISDHVAKRLGQQLKALEVVARAEEERLVDENVVHDFLKKCILIRCIPPQTK